MREVRGTCDCEQLVEVERDPAELDCERLVVHERVLAPATDADSPDAEPEGAVETAQPLLVDVTRGDRVGVHRRYAVGVRQHDVLVRRRRRVATEHAARAHRRLEGAQKGEPFLPELLARPVRRLEDALVGFLVPEVQGYENVVGVPVHARTPELLQELHAFARLRATLRDVAECDDQIGLISLQIRECFAERNGISVHVGEEGDAHTGTLYAASAAAISPSGT